MAAKANRVAEAEEHLKAATKAQSKGFLGMGKPNWEGAARRYDQAAKAFRQAGPAYKKREIDALSHASTAHENNESLHSAAKCLEQAALACAREEKMEREASDFYERGAVLYRQNQQPDKAAMQMCNAAKAVEETDPARARECYDIACKVYEEEDRAKFSHDTYKMYINFLVKTKEYDDAVDVLLRQNHMYGQSGASCEGDINKNNLSIVVLRFTQEQYADAVTAYDQMQVDDMSNFLCSKAAECIDALIAAWKAADNEALALALKTHQVTTFLDNSIARVARKLTFDTTKVFPQRAGDNALLESSEDEIDLT